MANDSVALNSLIQAIDVAQNSAGQDVKNNDSFSEIVGFKLWNKFVDWAHCHDLPLVVGAYGVHQRFITVSYTSEGIPQLKKKNVIVFMLGDEDRSIAMDRVSNDAKGVMLGKTEKLKKYSQELIDGEASLPPFPADVEGRLIPDDWFVERDSGTLPEEDGECEVLMMPAASKEKKERWSAENTKRGRSSADRGRDSKLLKRSEQEYFDKKSEMVKMLSEATKNITADSGFEENVKLFRKLAVSASAAKKKMATVKKYTTYFKRAEEEETTK